MLTIVVGEGVENVGAYSDDVEMEVEGGG